ncbi:hypothetical protein FB567DRAFT_536874 [Paraphoma chrysanthemicola]|uniref:ribonuclease T1 n=1 Tax=Paraphoma chrysanthemicola TaxID=798071 RepID=A0A8K0QX85_9PLEO|nr:hypothetical protein FB567DRAFT_536874 [Paraphoma chrysanthemicola]
MQLTNVFFSALAVLSAVSAAPTPIDVSPTSVELEARAPPTLKVEEIEGFPPKDWECKTSQTKDTTRKFSADYIKRSVEYALVLRDNGDNKAGNSKYPQFFTNPESIPGLEDYEDETDIDHFPLNYDDNTVFTGGSPTSDARVVYQHTVDDDDATFIGVWSHAGRKDGKFEKCKEL